MIRDEDVIKSTTGKYMKPHERVIYTITLALGVLVAIGGIIMLFVNDMWILGLILLVVGAADIIGVGLLLWTDGEKRKKRVGKKK